MGEAVIVTIETNGQTTVAAYCLKTDSWQDYVAFREDVKLANSSENQRNANRFLRAALTCLFSHLEAVVNDIYENCEIPNACSRHRLRLCDRIYNIGEEAKKIRNIPSMNFRLEKHLRDLIAHPGIQINSSGARGGNLTFVEVFNRLNINTLENIEAQISPWLDAVCDAFKVPRFTDTRQIVDDFCSSLGTSEEIREI